MKYLEASVELVYVYIWYAISICFIQPSQSSFLSLARVAGAAAPCLSS